MRKINLKTLNKVIYSLIIICGVYYLTGANDLSIKGFELQKLKRELSNTAAENKDMETRITYLDSYSSNLGQKIKALGMVAAGKADYLTAGSGAVARR